MRTFQHLQGLVYDSIVIQIQNVSVFSPTTCFNIALNVC